MTVNYANMNIQHVVATPRNVTVGLWSFIPHVCCILTGFSECRGPAFRISDYASNFLIGNAQFEAARQVTESLPPKVIFTSPDTTIETANTTVLTGVKGSVRSVHVYMNM